MTKLLYRSFLFSILLSLFLGCNQEEAARPLYLKIDRMHLQTDYSEEGTAHSDFSTVWVYLNDKIIGAFELPAILPVIPKEGKNELRLLAGISTNGISSFRSINTSLTPVNLEFDYENTGGAPDTLIIPEDDLVVTYKDFYEVTIVEDFDDPGLNFQRTAFSDTGFIKIDDADSIFSFQAYGANQPEPNSESGLIVLDAQNPQVDLHSVVSYSIPPGTQNLYLEITYRTNAQVGFGLVANLPTGDRSDVTAGVLPKSEWNKIYINLITELQAFPGASGYQVLIRAQKPDNLPEARIFLDNIKLVYIP
jgi:hypothetical protein